MQKNSDSVEQLYALFNASSGINIDTRKLKPGEIFWGIKGENFDGNQFAASALENGALAAVTDDKKFKDTNNSKLVYVENSLHKLAELASHHRKKCAFKILALTGSNGKTTTKELCQAVLETTFKTQSTPGNFNNEIGVPLTLLGFKQDTEFGIVELGARNVGDIKYLCEFVKPDSAIITNFGKDHLEIFGSIENVMKANSEVVDYLKNKNHILFLNADDKKMQQFAKGNYTSITYGQSKNATFSGSIINHNLPYLSFHFHYKNETYRVNSRLTGTYNFYNFMAAIATGLHFGIKPGKIVQALENYTPKANRSQVLKSNSNTFIMDAYNANPDSMQAALLNFKDIHAEKKWMILGDMLELGDYSEHEHAEILKLAKSIPHEKLILTGECFPKEKSDRILYFKNVSELKNWWKDNQPQNTLILLKASRGIALEKLLEDAE